MRVWFFIGLSRYTEVQATMAGVQIIPGSSESLINQSGDSEFYQLRQRKDTISAEIKGYMDLFFGGRGGDDVKLRIAISDLIFGVKSKEAADALPMEKLERG